MCGPTMQASPDGVPPNEKATAFEILLDRALARCDSTKKDLDYLWTTQILAVGLSVALVAGLDPKAVSQAVCHTDSCGNALYIILPLVNLYFMMRFGFLTFAFSEARSAAETLSKRFKNERGLSQYIRDDHNTTDLSRIVLHVLYSTNSYFDPLFIRPDSVLKRALVYVYSFSIPCVFAFSHSTSIYLLLKVLCPNLGAWALSGIAVYVVILIALYKTLYDSLQRMPFGVPNLMLFIAIVSPILTIIFLMMFIYIR